MQLKTKKRIAREVLIFFSCGILTLVFYLLTFLYNAYFQQKVNKSQSLIDSRSIQLDSLYKKKPLIVGYAQNKKDIFAEFGGSIISSVDSLPIFDKDDLKNKNLLIDKISSEMRELGSEKRLHDAQILNNRSKLDYTKLFGLILISICFPLRYIFKIVLWSLKTLKQD